MARPSTKSRAVAARPTRIRFNFGLNRRNAAANGRDFVIRGVGILDGAIVKVFNSAGTQVFEGTAHLIETMDGTLAIARVRPRATSSRAKGKKHVGSATDQLTITVTNPDGTPESAPSPPRDVDLYTD